MTLVEIIEKWMKEDEFIASHFKIKSSPRSKSECTINMACYHDAAGRSWDKLFVGSHQVLLKVTKVTSLPFLSAGLSYIPRHRCSSMTYVSSYLKYIDITGIIVNLNGAIRRNRNYPCLDKRDL